MKHKIEIGESIKEPLMIPIRGIWNQMQNTTSDLVSLKLSTSDLFIKQFLNPISEVGLMSRSSDQAVFIYGAR